MYLINLLCSVSKLYRLIGICFSLGTVLTTDLIQRVTPSYRTACTCKSIHIVNITRKRTLFPAHFEVFFLNKAASFHVMPHFLTLDNTLQIFQDCVKFARQTNKIHVLLTLK